MPNSHIRTGSVTSTKDCTTLTTVFLLFYEVFRNLFSDMSLLTFFIFMIYLSLFRCFTFYIKEDWNNKDHGLYVEEELELGRVQRSIFKICKEGPLKDVSMTETAAQGKAE